MPHDPGLEVHSTSRLPSSLPQLFIEPRHDFVRVGFHDIPAVEHGAELNCIETPPFALVVMVLLDESGAREGEAPFLSRGQGLPSDSRPFLLTAHRRERYSCEVAPRRSTFLLGSLLRRVSRSATLAD